MPSATVLLVEDEEADVFFVRRALAEIHVRHPLRVVSDGRDAIEYLAGHGRYEDRQRYPLPGLVLLDLSLPLMRGLEVLAWIRARAEFQSLAVVIFSGSEAPVDQEKARQMGANQYVVKPTDMTQLRPLLQEIFTRWLPAEPPG
jgi:CheY-like chemotaxis protein